MMKIVILFAITNIVFAILMYRKELKNLILEANALFLDNIYSIGKATANLVVAITVYLVVFLTPIAIYVWDWLDVSFQIRFWFHWYFNRGKFRNLTERDLKFVNNDKIVWRNKLHKYFYTLVAKKVTVLNRHQEL